MPGWHDCTTKHPLLLATLQIHSVEARHASEVRRLRGNFLDQVPDCGWITLNETDIGVLSASAIYAGEQNTIQDGVNLVSLSFSADDASEAFDEPLTV